MLSKEASSTIFWVFGMTRPGMEPRSPGPLTMAWWLVFTNGQETWVQSQVESYHRLKKWHLMPPCLTLSIIRNGSRVKWSNPGKGVTPFPTPWCSNYWKGSLQVTLDYGRQLYFTAAKMWYKNNKDKEKS